MEGERSGPVLRFFRTTAFKLSVIYLVVFAALSVFLIVYLGRNTTDMMTQQMTETIDAELVGLAEQYRAGGIPRLVRVINVRSSSPGASLYLLTDFAGNRIAGNVADISSTVLNAADGIARPVHYMRLEQGDAGVDTPAAANGNKALVRVFVLPGGFRLLVGRDLAERERLSSVVQEAYWISAGVFVMLGLITWVFVSRRVLKRIDAISLTTGRIMQGDLAGRLAVDGSGDEFDRLATSLNTMLERIEQLMRGVKEVSDNIAHDLRTPLTRLRARVEDTLRKAPSEDLYRETLEATVEDCESLMRTFEALLRIARVEAGTSGVTLEAVDVSGIAGDVAELYEPVVEDAGFRLETEIAAGLTVSGNRELLAQALINLIDNALKYGRPADDATQPVIRLVARRAGDRVLLTVADNGPGVPQTDRARIFNRFVRLEKSRTAPGSGLGLSLVQAVTRLMHGAIVPEDAAPGLSITLSLPAL